MGESLGQALAYPALSALGCQCVLNWMCESVSPYHGLVTLLVDCTSRAGNLNWAKRTEDKTAPLEICSTVPGMVHLCVSISDDGPRLESMQKGSPKSMRKKGKEVLDMATLRRQSRSRTASTRQDRGSCSSTASCPVFSGPYSDQEEDPPLRRQSSPLLKGSLSSLPNSKNQSPKSSLSSLHGSVSSLQGSLPSLSGSLPSFKDSLCSLRGSISRTKRQLLVSLDNQSPGPSDRSISPSLLSRNGSSSDDDGSWDTNSWSSGATCLLRTPVKQDNKDASGEKEKSCTTNHMSAAAGDEPEVIYQNLIFSRNYFKSEGRGGCSAASTLIGAKKDAEIPGLAFTSLGKNTLAVGREKKPEDRRKFSQFLNEVSVRVLKSSNDTPKQQTTLRQRYPSPPPPPPSTPSHAPLATSTHSSASTPNLPPLSSSSATNMWYSPTNSNLQTIEECDLKDIASSIHQWSKTLPSCKVLEPEELLRKVKGEIHSFPKRDPEPCAKIQTHKPSSERMYLETDIDRVRRIDELVANGTLGKEKVEKGREKCAERGRHKEKRKESVWERDRAVETGNKKDKGSEKPSWEKDRRVERGREKEKKVTLSGYNPSPPPLPTLGGQSNPCPVFTWPNGYPKMSYRSTSLPRAVNMTVSIHLRQKYPSKSGA